jgi:hypothetical protein
MTREEEIKDLEAKMYALQYSINRIGDLFNSVYGQRPTADITKSLDDLFECLDELESLTDIVSIIKREE